jgi:hypothetical protein
MKRRALSHLSGDSRLPITAAACAIFAVLTFPTFGAQQNPVDPRADELLKRMGDFLGQAKFFSVNAEIWQDINLASGQQIQAGRALKLQVRRPNRLHSELTSPRRHHELIYDGSSITLFNRAQNFFGTIAAPGTLDEAMDLASDKFGMAMPLEDFISSDPHKDLLQRVVSGSEIGQVTVMGTPCEHLAFSEGNIDWQVWIERGPRPVPKKFVITYKDEPDSPEFTAIFSNWDFTTQLPDFIFKFEPPAGAAKIKVKEIREENQSHQTEKEHK